MKSFYIYPKGLNAQILAFHLKDLYKIKAKFIDDNDEKSSLKSLKEKINKEDVIFLASKKFQNILVANLLKYNIEQFCDGIGIIAKKLNEILKAKFGLSIGVVLSENINEKYLNIPKNGYELNANIVYFAPSLEVYKKAKLRFKNVVFAGSNWLSYFDFLTCYISSDYLISYNQPDVKTFVLGTNYIVANYHDFYHDKKDIYHFEGMIANRLDSYTLMHCKHFFNALKISNEKLGGGGGFLPLGYMSIKNDMNAYKQGKKRDSVILLMIYSKNYPFKEIIMELCEKLLENGIRVLFKSHYQHTEIMDKFDDEIKKFKKYPNFILYTKAKLSLNELSRSITLVEFRSSLNYTYPIITKKPSLLLIPNSIKHGKNNFYNKNLHVEFRDLNQALNFILRLKNDENLQKKYENSIKFYIKIELYDPELILPYIQNWHEKELRIRRNLLNED